MWKWNGIEHDLRQGKENQIWKWADQRAGSTTRGNTRHGDFVVSTPNSARSTGWNAVSEICTIHSIRQIFKLNFFDLDHPLSLQSNEQLRWQIRWLCAQTAQTPSVKERQIKEATNQYEAFRDLDDAVVSHFLGLGYESQKGPCVFSSLNGKSKLLKWRNTF